MEVSSAGDLENAFEGAIKARSGAMAVTATPLFGANRKRIIDLALDVRLASVFNSRESVDDGGLMSYGMNPTNLYRRAAIYVDKIFKGLSPLIYLLSS
jgi:putative tryptophan/tyrosine transport system substrate-binding protein